VNIYSRKQKWKLILFFLAVVIGMASLYYTNILVRKLAEEERKSVRLWAEATKEFSNSDSDVELNFITTVMINNNTIPVILMDEEMNFIHARNLDPEKSLTDSTKLSAEDYARNLKYLNRQLEIMISENEPIVINFTEDQRNYIYYKDSILLNQLFYYPFIQLAVIFLFIFVSYYAFSSSRKAEQNQVWVGMSKETAHQLGTPISSLIAWIEYMKMKDMDKEIIKEIEKDIVRLETITERFSKIGSAPVLTRQNVIRVLEDSINYIKRRTSDKVNYNLHFSLDDEVLLPLNLALFEWVIENLCKNALDAMEGAGDIDIYLQDNTQIVYIDIQDSGKGIAKTKYKTVFQPGYTTKNRGWGLGLSLAQRIIENYHDGKIFVKSSDPAEGTTFRIALKK
jgi:signal transduction histidine kinase